MLKRISTVLLALIFICLPMAGCKDEAVLSGQSQVDVKGDFYGLDIPDDVDFGSKTVRVLTTSTAQSATTHQIKPTDNTMFSEESASSVMTTALECTRIVEEKLNIIVEEETVYTFNRYGGEMLSLIHI